MAATPALANRPTKKPAAAHKHKVAKIAKARHTAHHHKHHAKSKTSAKP
jgi:hypothetical protein